MVDRAQRAWEERLERAGLLADERFEMEERDRVSRYYDVPPALVSGGVSGGGPGGPPPAGPALGDRATAEQAPVPHDLHQHRSGGTDG